MDLYNGSLELETLPDFLNDLCQADDIGGCSSCFGEVLHGEGCERTGRFGLGSK